MRMLQYLLIDESAQSTAEYGMLLALMSLASIAVLTVLGPRSSGFFQFLDDALQTAQP
jgi:Flp pilus assembly pilin Flp